MKIRKLRIGIVGFALVAGYSFSAHATPTLSLWDQVNAPVIITDGSVLDLNPAVGVITYSGSVGPWWSINVSTAVGAPILGSLVLPSLDLNSLNVANTANKALVVQFSADNYGPTPATQWQADIGGTASGNVIYKTAISPNNVAYTAGDGLAIQGDMTTLIFNANGGFSGTAIGSFAGDAQYSVTLKVKITPNQVGQVSYDASMQAIPTPDAGMTLSLLGLGMISLGAIRRKMA